MRRLRNAHRGQKAVIICNGPSLNQIDFGLLDGVFTIGMNQLYYLFETSSFRPSCMLTVDINGIERGKEFLNKTDIPLFLNHKGISMVPPRPNITYLHEVRTRKFARDLSMSFYGGYTVTYTALQLAYHLGFDEVALIGCDHNYYREGEDRFKPVDLSEGNFQHHFTNKYLTGFQKAFPASLTDIEYGYRVARDFFEGSGRKVYNCTVGGQLEIFPRLTLEEFLAKPAG
jgi:hypothetical protein